MLCKKERKTYKQMYTTTTKEDFSFRAGLEGNHTKITPFLSLLSIREEKCGLLFFQKSVWETEYTSFLFSFLILERCLVEQ